MCDPLCLIVHKTENTYRLFEKTIEERRMFAYLYNFKQSDVKGLLRCLQKQIWLENVKKVTLTYHPLESWKTGWPKCAEHYLDDGCGIS